MSEDSSPRKVLRTHPIAERASKVRLDHLAPAPTPLPGFLARLPHQFAAESLRLVVRKVCEARRAGRPVLVGFGAHVIKCGLGPIWIDLARRGLFTRLASNGATLVHDAELALFGHTSEEVASGLRDGTFGMAEETHQFLNAALTAGAAEGLGAGASVGRALVEAKAPYLDQSVLGQSYLLGTPLTIHIALGTDIIHMHPTANGAAIGQATLHDFHDLAGGVAELAQGVLLNFGSAVLLPEVLLKAFAMAANRGIRLDGCLSVDFDMVRGYRASTQLVDRIRHLGGDGTALTGHHEIMIPLLAGLLLAEWETPGGAG